jgi:hypothetical protein
VLRVDLGKARWGIPVKNVYKLVGSTSYAIGTGNANTEAIVDVEGANCAAGRAWQLRTQGYNDWYLPSWEELRQLGWAAHQGLIPSLRPGCYWSSSEGQPVNSTNPYAAMFLPYPDYDPDATSHKWNAYIVRPIRSFRASRVGP